MVWQAAPTQASFINVNPLMVLGKTDLHRYVTCVRAGLRFVCKYNDLAIMYSMYTGIRSRSELTGPAQKQCDYNLIAPHRVSIANNNLYSSSIIFSCFKVRMH